jgi:hypothetical protein
MREYEERDQLLRDLGFHSYQHYLNSPLWKSIRRRALSKCGSQCLLCGVRGTNVHHTEYSLATIRGKKINTLVVLCRTCHELAEFGTGGKKLPLSEANARLGLLRTRAAGALESLDARRRRHMPNYENIARSEKAAGRRKCLDERRARRIEERKRLPGWCPRCGLNNPPQGKTLCRKCEPNALPAGAAEWLAFNDRKRKQEA